MMRDSPTSPVAERPELEDVAEEEDVFPVEESAGLRAGGSQVGVRVWW